LYANESEKVSGEREVGGMGRPPRPGRKKRDLRGKKLFENPETSSEEETPPPSESEDAIDNDDEDDEDDNTPLFQVRQTMRQSNVGSRSSQSRPPTAAAMVRKPDSSQATTIGTTPSAFENNEEDVEDGREDSPEPLGGGPLSPEEPFMIGSATEEQLPAGQAAHFMAKNLSSTHMSGASNKVRAHSFLFNCATKLHFVAAMCIFLNYTVSEISELELHRTLCKCVC
jgi:hypothetical protein